MLFNIIDSKIGRYRVMYTFQNKYGQIIANIKQKRKENNFKPSNIMNDSIIKAYNEIDYDDCILAASFFITHFNMDKKLYTNPKKYNRATVHIFAEFQNCLKHTMNLNALLGYPYPQIKIANLFNGTLLYNLSNNFRTRNDIEEYINTVFQIAPSLLRLLNIFLLKIKPMFPSMLQNKINLLKKQRIKSKYSKSDKNISAESDSEYFTADDDLYESCYDPNNRFSMLNHSL